MPLPIYSRESGSEQLAYLWKIYFDFQYFLFCSPFRLKQEKGNGSDHFVTTSWRPQKILCGVFTLLGLIWISRSVRMSLPADSDNPALYLLMILNIVMALFKMVRIKKYWLDQVKLVKIVNFIVDREHGFKIPSTPFVQFLLTTTKGKVIFIFVCLTYAAMATGNWVSGRDVVSENMSERWSVSWWWARMVELSRSNFFLTNDTSSVTESTFGALTAAGFLWRLLLGCYLESFLLLVAFTAWLMPKAFAEQLLPADCRRKGKLKMPTLDLLVLQKKCRPKCWHDVRKEYEIIKEFIDLINEIFGWSQCYFVLETILFYCVSFDEMFVKESFPDWGKIFSVSFYFMTTCAALLFSADLCKQVRVHNYALASQIVLYTTLLVINDSV